MNIYLGNIVIDRQSTFSDECFRVFHSLEDVDNNLPTLIIGLTLAKRYITDFNILVKTNSDRGLWWTFTRNERLMDYEVDYDNFFNYCVWKYTQNIQYINVRIHELTFEKLYKWVHYAVYSTHWKYYYIDDNKCIFLYDKEVNKVFGFSLVMLDYLGVKAERVVNILSRNKYNWHLYNFWKLPKKLNLTLKNNIPTKVAMLAVCV